jgi:hypothetical protein
MIGVMLISDIWWMNEIDETSGQGRVGLASLAVRGQTHFLRESTTQMIMMESGSTIPIIF